MIDFDNDDPLASARGIIVAVALGVMAIGLFAVALAI